MEPRTERRKKGPLEYYARNIGQYQKILKKKKHNKESISALLLDIRSLFLCKIVCLYQNFRPFKEICKDQPIHRPCNISICLIWLSAPEIAYWRGLVPATHSVQGLAVPQHTHTPSWPGYRPDPPQCGGQRGSAVS